MIVNRDNYPRLRAALASIECNSGGHLIGVVYPGKKIDLENFKIPDEWSHLVEGADRGLSRLDAHDFETFVIGEQSEQEAIERRQGDLSEAHILLNDYFNGFQPEDAPFMARRQN